MKDKSKDFLKKNKFKLILSFLLIIYLSVFLFNQVKPIPYGLDYKSEFYSVDDSDIKFLYDLTYEDSNGSIIVEQEIFDEKFKLIQGAKNYILLDMFLFNSHGGNLDSFYKNLSSLLSEELVVKKINSPNIEIDFITDNLNTVYGGYSDENINYMVDNGINVYFTNLNMLRDSNPVYSSFWRLFLIWFGNSDNNGWISHPFDSEEKVTVRSYLNLLNFKANHRKVIIADNNQGEFSTIVSSANPHDGSSEHSNVAVRINGSFAQEIYKTELAVSEDRLVNVSFDEFEELGKLNVMLITEKKIRDNILEQLSNLSEGDVLNIGIFYISDRKVVKEILDANKRGVEVNIVLDPNKDAFGYEKNGIPNRQVAYELHKKSDGKINIRWYNTNGEQYHSKIIHIKKQDGSSVIILGSSNFTKRNLGNYNLELNVLVIGGSESEFFQEIDFYFDRILNNFGGDLYTLDYEEFEDRSLFRYYLYRFQEFTGFSTF